MSMIVELLSFKKNKNSTAIGGGTSFGTFNVILKEETSVVNPVFIIDMNYNGAPSGPDLIRANYLYCGHFQRRYWINDIVFITDDVAEIHCTVDVLGTYINGIMNSEAYVNYANKSYNALIPDKRIPMQITHKFKKYEATIPSISQTGAYILFCASSEVDGQTGLAQGFVCSAGDLSSIASKLLDTGFLSKVIDNIYAPLDSIFSCMWLPCDSGKVGGGAKSIKFGDYDGGSYKVAMPKMTTYATIVVELPYQDPITGYYDWRNVAPWTDWYLWLPGVGYIEFPMEKCINQGQGSISIEFTIQVSVTNGECSYTAKCNSTIVMFCKGNIGVAVPVAKTGNGLGNVLAQSASVSRSLGVMAMTTNPAIATAGALSAVSSGIGAGAGLVQHSVSASGAIGGWSIPQDMLTKVQLFCICNDFATNPFGNVKDLIGCPVFKESKLSTYTGGKVFCSNINYDWSGEMFPKDEEYEMIRSALTSQDGVWLEQSI